MNSRDRSNQAAQVAEIERLLAMEAHAHLITAVTSEDAADKAATTARRRCDEAVARWETHLGSPGLSLEFARLLGGDVTAAEIARMTHDDVSAHATARREEAERVHAMALARRRAAERSATAERRKHQRRVEDRRLAELPHRGTRTQR